MLQLLEHVTAVPRPRREPKIPSSPDNRSVVDPSRELLRRCGERRPNVVEVELLTPFRSRSDRTQFQAASPIPKQIREARGAVVLFGLQLRVRQDVDGYEKKPYPSPWNTRANA